MAIHSDNWSQSLRYVADSDVGMRRSNNQDSFAVVLASDADDWCQRGHIFTVADGMGAHAAGELASKLAADTLPHTYKKLSHLSPPESLQTAIQEANALIHARGQASVDFQGMGTTCSVLVVLPQGALIGHVGDSRIYRLRGRQFEQLTFDHSLAWELEVAQKAARSTVQLNVPKNVITRSLGPHAEVQVDLEGPFPIAVGDKYLLCSDGLTGPVHDAEIGAILDHLPTDEAVQTLIDLANLRGGPDNVTVIALEITGPRLAAGSVEASPTRRPGGKPTTVHPAIWAASGIGLAVALLFMAIGNPIGAGVGAFVAVGALCVGLISKLAGSSASSVDPLGGPFGRGPYRRYDTTISRSLIEELASLVDKLASTAQQQLGSYDQPRHTAEIAQAADAFESGDLDQALSNYAHCIRQLMQAFRKSGHSNATGPL